MALKGKLVRKDGNALIFGTRNKPEWRPMYIDPNLDTTNLQEGKFYEIETSDNRVHRLTELGPPQAQSGGGSAPRSSGPTSTGGGFNNSLCASATGVIKSLIEGGMDYEEAKGKALNWAAVWDESAPTGKPKPVPPAPAEQMAADDKALDW